MANELSRDDGIAVTLLFSLVDAPANTANVLALPGGNAGFTVPAGYKFHALALNGMSNADLTAGTATFAVTDGGTVITNGPTALLNDDVQAAVGVQRVGANPIAAGHVVGVKATTNAAYAPETSELDAVLIGLLLPA